MNDICFPLVTTLRHRVIVLAACLLSLIAARATRAAVIYATNFEHPVFDNSLAFAGQNGWATIGVSSAVRVGPPPGFGSAHWVEVNASQAGTQQTGLWRNSPFDTATSTDKVVVMESRVTLGQASTNSAWQFAGLTSNLAAFIGGFNVLTDGRLQLITAGLPTTAPIISRNTDYVYSVRFDFAAQKFDVLVDGFTVAASQPFYSSQTVFGAGLFDTFGGATVDDIAFFDDYSVVAIPEPGSLAMFSLGLLAVWLTRCRSRPVVAANRDSEAHRLTEYQTMNRTFVVRMLVLACAAIVAGAKPCMAQPPAEGVLVSVGMFRNGSFTQTGDGASLATNGYWFSAFATTGPPFAFFQVDLYRPGAPIPELMLPADPFLTSFMYSGFLLPSQAAMDAEFPMGEYLFQATGLSFDAASVVYDADHYPLSLPYLSGSNYSAAQGMNATAPFTFEFNPYDPGAGVDESLLFFSLFDTDTNSTAYNAGFLPASTTSLTIPANTLVPGDTYRYELIYSNRKVVDAVGAEFPALLAFDLRTEGTFLASVPEPATLVLCWPAIALFGYLVLVRRRAPRT